MLLSENFDFQNEGNGGVTALRLIVGPRDIRRLQRFAHLTTMKTLSTSSIAGEMYKLTNQQNQITDLNFYEWCDDFVEMNLSLPGEISWVKERFLSMFSVLSRDGMNTMELSDIVSGLTMFTQGSIDKFRLAFELYGFCVRPTLNDVPTNHRGDIDSNKVATEANKAGMGVLEKRMETLETKLTSSSAGPVLTNTGMKEAHEKFIRTEKKLIIETQQQIEASKIELLATHDSLTAKYRYSVKALYAAHTTELKKRQRIIENSESRINDENTTFRRNTVTFSQAEN